jgi:hypothetical protein
VKESCAEALYILKISQRNPIRTLMLLIYINEATELQDLAKSFFSLLVIPN